jgi:hypothetical protein
VATPENIYQSACELIKAMGFKNADKFVSDPAKAPPQPPKPSPEEIGAQTALQLKQMDMQADAQKFQAQTQLKQTEIQLQAEAKLREMQSSLEVQAANDQRDAEREQLRAQMDAELKAQEAQMKAAMEAQRLEFDMWKARLDAETKVLVAQIAAQTKEVETPAEQLAEGGIEEPSPNAALAAAMAGFTQALSEMRAPRTIVRGPDGRAEGIV